ncbi:LysR family transcriptional regulator [Mesorhizobium sp. M1A.F.Ca.IN.022.07.1.1]|uniref:LysR family transcriptional regulator n=1 Tax=unclassified Mesorhizobium TaxID=325217 RepID=UPI0007FD06A5|nr:MULTISPECIES: LysR family transcriptional regulator [unclassified Mesorhizobium]TGV92898.1 LysR family transcriptional regulator [Mesorhizobium sp. M00.F.Ca.ET.158.01.1.1]MCT2580483.1 LysR family transcriptional regulator [Mesorhizobium sp. P13.3]MDF3169425.1 LysR family transcriptional regulator [Mesorhizobium sp. P16.1]MDF3178913.1 LysR family transcriptional regulator [Mesorhizobium sp. P17.1]MDF3186340.1 LysR family transcriptional regulator [Mesorhizobium sp. ICCV3110.1]
MQPNPTLDQLQILVAVADTGSFSAAGRKLNRAQSVVSYGIANLEAQLGLKLFEREGLREPQLTDVGKAMLEDARRMIGVLQRIRSRADGYRQGLEAEVNLSVDVALPSPALVRVLKAFEAQFPAVMLRLYIGSLGLIVDQVVNGQSDLGFGGLQGDADVNLLRIGFISLVPAAAPDHPLAKLPKPIAIEDLRDHIQLVVSDQSERTRGRDYGVFAYRTWRLTDVRTKHALMREGLGWGGLPRWLIADDIASGRLVELDLEPYREVRAPMYAMHRNDRSPKPAASWLIDEFKRQLGCFNELEPGVWTEEEPETSRP